MKHLRLTELEKKQLLIANYSFIDDYHNQLGCSNKSIRANITAADKLDRHLHYLEFKEDWSE